MLHGKYIDGKQKSKIQDKQVIYFNVIKQIWIGVGSNM